MDVFFPYPLTHCQQPVNMLNEVDKAVARKKPTICILLSRHYLLNPGRMHLVETKKKKERKISEMECWETVNFSILFILVLQHSIFLYFHLESLRFYKE